MGDAVAEAAAGVITSNLLQWTQLACLVGGMIFDDDDDEVVVVSGKLDSSTVTTVFKVVDIDDTSSD